MPHFPQEREIVRHQIRNRLAEIEESIYRDRQPITGWETVITGECRDVEKMPQGGWKSFDVITKSGERTGSLKRPVAVHYRLRVLGTQWGWFDRSQWFRATVSVPDTMKGSPVVALLDPGAEALCYVNGVPTQGLDANRSEVLLTPCAEGGEVFEIVIEASATPNVFDDDPIRLFKTPFLAIKDTLAWDLYWDIQVGQELVETLPEGSDKLRFADLVERSVKMVDLNRVDEIDRYHVDLKSAQETFRNGRKEFEKTVDSGRVINVGHSHIDTAWLWAIRETRKKSSRTFSTVLKYMDQYPHYTYTQGQPQLYAWIEEHYPEIFEGIKKRISDGRWEANGASWVEQDSNLAGAEALVRQYLYGRRYFQNVLGSEANVAWLPDAFGFPITMPQILAKAGVRAFGTTKINWSQYNPFPYHTFRWRGLDGTELFSFMPPGHYNGVVKASDARKIWNTYLQKDISGEILNTYGHGDGGGGPTQEMLENLSRLEEFTGLPKMEVGNIGTYVDEAVAGVDWEQLPIYNEELYLELHRGCQTTQAHTKRNNRKTELLMRDAEALSALSLVTANEPYLNDEITKAWKIILTNQFHDILPGSSVNEVYVTADKDYSQVYEIGRSIKKRAIDTLDSRIDTSGDGAPIVVHNTLGWIRNDVAIVPVANKMDDVAVVDPSGSVMPSQFVETANGGAALLFETKEIPSLGYSVYRTVCGKTPVKNTLKVSKTRLENEFFTVKLTNTGTIKSVFDKRTNREAIAEGAEANDLQIFEDRPSANEAWDIDFNIDENRRSIDDVVSIDVVEEGPVRATVRVIKKTEHSTFVQDISIWRSISRIDFRTTVDWHEKRRLLKVAFPVDVLSRTATYEVQFGAHTRPTHHSNSFDRAKFEVAGHRWIDLSESEFGVSLLNDCKYGFDTYQNTMRISLLRASLIPDPLADQGTHEFVYSMYPHQGDWRKADTVRRAYELNVPLTAHVRDAHEGDMPKQYGFVSVDKPSVIIESVKKAEDSDAVIVRLYEAHGTRGPLRLAFAETPKSVTECNLMEEDDQPVDLDGAVVKTSIAPWEIKTFKVAF